MASTSIPDDDLSPFQRTQIERLGKLREVFSGRSEQRFGSAAFGVILILIGVAIVIAINVDAGLFDRGYPHGADGHLTWGNFLAALGAGVGFVVAGYFCIRWAIRLGNMGVHLFENGFVGVDKNRLVNFPWEEVLIVVQAIFRGNEDFCTVHRKVGTEFVIQPSDLTGSRRLRAAIKEAVIAAGGASSTQIVD